MNITAGAPLPYLPLYNKLQSVQGENCFQPQHKLYKLFTDTHYIRSVETSNSPHEGIKHHILNQSNFLYNLGVGVSSF